LTVQEMNKKGSAQDISHKPASVKASTLGKSSVTRNPAAVKQRGFYSELVAQEAESQLGVSV